MERDAGRKGGIRNRGRGRGRDEGLGRIYGWRDAERKGGRRNGREREEETGMGV